MRRFSCTEAECQRRCATGSPSIPTRRSATRTATSSGPWWSAAGKAAAWARRLDFNKYAERLIIEDTTGTRAAGITAAQRLIKEHGAFLDGLEEQLDAPYAQRQSGTAA